MNEEQKKTTRAFLKYTPFYWLMGLLIVFGALFCGIKLRSAAISAGSLVLPIACLVFLCAVPPLFVLLQTLRTRSYEKKLREMDAAERVGFLLSHREHAEQTAAEKYRLLKRLRGGSTAAACLLTVCGAAVPFLTSSI